MAGGGQDNDKEKTEEATDAKREDFRKKGQVAQTRELASALFILAASLGIYALSKFFFAELAELFNRSLGSDLVTAARTGSFNELVILTGQKFLLLMAPILGVAFVVAIGSTVAQIGFLNVEDALVPKPEKIDPIAGFKRMFNLRTLVEGLKAVIKLLFIGGVTYLVFKSEVMVIPFLMEKSPAEIMAYMGAMSAKILGVVGLAMVVIAAIDYFFQRWDLEKQMMMSKDEVKEEVKSREGDPMIKARVRRIQRDLANRRMMDKVPKATVIVTNPTHIAVALKYDETLPAPQIVAMGADLIAEKIRNLAKEHNIPIVENKPLARTIFKTLKIGQVIPRELFVAVAEVLSYVFRLQKKVRR